MDSFSLLAKITTDIMEKSVILAVLAKAEILLHDM